MDRLKKLRSKIAEKRAAMQALVDTADREKRDMSADEKSKFDQLAADVTTLKDQVAKLQEAETEDEDEDQQWKEEQVSNDPPPAPTRGRRSQPMRPQDSPAVHTKERRWSLLRALQLSYERRTRPFDGVEGEIHQELARRRSGEPAQGILIPLGNEPEFRELMFGKAERRDVTTTTGSGAIFVVAELPFIELLRNKLVIKALGATFLTGLQGKVAIPRQNAASTAYWVAEGVAVTASNPTLDQVPLTDKTLGGLVNISRKFLYQSSVDAEMFVKNDLAQVLAIELDRAAINGSGSGAVPLGVLQNSTIQTNSAGLQGGTNGAIPSFPQLVGMESQVAGFNADRGSLKYLTSPALRGTLKTTVKNAGTGYPIFLAEDNEVNGHPLMVTSNVPTNQTKGTATNCSAIIFGNWEDLLVGQWGGIDTVVNPYTNQASGAVTISMMMEADVAVRHPESFAIVTDAKVS